MTIDGKPISCANWPTVLDANLNDFAVSYPGFIVMRPDVIATVSTSVAMWIYSHECGHLHGIEGDTRRIATQSDVGDGNTGSPHEALMRCAPSLAARAGPAPSISPVRIVVR